MTCWIERWATAAMVLFLSLSALPAHAARGVATERVVGEEQNLEDLFVEASDAFGVPVEILMALGYTESRWNMRDGAPSIDFAYGIMGLRERDDIDTLGFAAELLDLPRERLKRNPRANIFGAAAVLEALAKNYYQFEVESVRELSLEAWEPVLREYSGMPDATTYVLQLYTPIHRGIDTMNDAGERIHFGPVKIDLASFEEIEPRDKVFSQDYPPAAWDPAASCNYTWSERPASYPIEMVVIHVTQGSYAGTISWFKNCSAGASAHYVIRSSDGAVTQMVGNGSIAWHAGNWDYNTRSIGIEHEGFISECSWFTDAMYRSS
ncbi:MAG: amidase, partial [Deltaproteobacteria bacterium]